jgi:tRNA pseudouridine13 synthase
LEDFEVEEVPLYPPCGEGEHTFLLIEKRGIDTEAVVRDLERELRVPRLGIGYAGRKDRWAVTRQWVSLPRLEPAAALALAGESWPIPGWGEGGWRVLEAVKHRHKLRTGDLVANRFRIVVRELGPSGAGAARDRLAELARRGMPNRFGRQRFGREGDNAAAGAAILRGDRAGGKRRRGDRRQTRFLVSALQSALFNQVLERRPAPPWELLDGDLALVHRSGGLFLVGDASAESARAAALDISPTGPIFGTKMRQPGGAVRELEESVWREQGLPGWDELELPRGLHVDGTRRALRVPIGDASQQTLDDDAIELRFELPAGSYATVLIEELFPREVIAEGAPRESSAVENETAGPAET